MRKIVLFLFAVFVLGIGTTQAQDYDKALGLRLGYPAAITYKQFISNTGAIEGIAGWWWGGAGVGNSLNVAVLYEHHGNITNGLNWFVGAGPELFIFSAPKNAGVGVAVDLILGLDYKINSIPLNLSLDWKPSFYLTGIGNGFGMGWQGFALSARYTF